MRNADDVEFCVSCPLFDDDEGIDRWFMGLVCTPHASDTHLSAVVDAGEQLLASFERLLGVTRDEKPDPVC